MSALDKAALMTSPIPIAGDVIGGIADAKALYDDPSWTNAGMALAGLLPWVPPMVAARSVKQGIKDNTRSVIQNMPNHLPGFYEKPTGVLPDWMMKAGGNKLDPLTIMKLQGGAHQLGAAAYGGLQGLGNLTQAQYSPHAQGLFKEAGVSLTDQKVAREMLARMEGTHVDSLADKIGKQLDSKYESNPQKKLVGMLNQSRNFVEQYNGKSFLKLLDGMDNKAWAELNPEAYRQVVGKATGLNDTNLNAVFREFTGPGIQNVKEGENVRMVIRNANASASGNLWQGMSKRVFGGQTLGDMKKVFNGKPFKTNEDLLKALDEKNVGVRNREGVLKNGEDPIVTGSSHTDAYDLGGVNYMTVVHKNGTMTSFVNDEHDVFAVKAPLGDRLVAVSTPLHIDIFNKKRRGRGVQKALDAANIETAAKRQTVENVMETIHGVDPSKKVPKGMSKAQHMTAQAVAKMEPQKRGAAEVSFNVMNALFKAGKPVSRSEDEE